MPTIRPYCAADRAEMMRVYYRAVREGAASVYSADELAAWAPTDQPDWTKPDKLLDQWAWVAEEDGRMTGFMSLRRDGELDMAFVLPEVMGKGTAAALYDVLLAQARVQGFARMTVHASEFSRRFLQRRGWQFDGMVLILEGGQNVEVASLHLDLPAPTPT